MNELLQKHGCANVFTVPEGLKELMSDITREVLREQPPRIYEFIANYLSALLITREHGILAIKILEDLCDCRPSVSEHLIELGFEHTQASHIARIIQEEIENFEPIKGKEKLKETLVIKQILRRNELDDEMVTKVCEVIRTAYKDYWYRKKLLEESLTRQEPTEAWEEAAQRTLELYKTTRPSFTELNRSIIKIQAAYRGYHFRKRMLQKRRATSKVTGPKMEHVGVPIDIAESREIDLGKLVNVKVKGEEVVAMFADHIGETLGLPYNPMTAITNVDEETKKTCKKRTLSVSENVEKIDAPSAASSEIDTQYLMSMNKKISFAGQGPIIIPIRDVDDVIPEDLPDGRGVGDGDSTSSVSSVTEPANISDDDD